MKTVHQKKRKKEKKSNYENYQGAAVPVPVHIFVSCVSLVQLFYGHK